MQFPLLSMACCKTPSRYSSKTAMNLFWNRLLAVRIVSSQNLCGNTLLHESQREFSPSNALTAEPFPRRAILLLVADYAGFGERPLKCSSAFGPQKARPHPNNRR